MRRYKLNPEFERYNNALLKLAILPEFQVVIDYLQMNYIDPTPSSATGDLVKLGVNLGKMELAKEVVELSKRRQEVTTNE